MKWQEQDFTKVNKIGDKSFASQYLHGILIEIDNFKYLISVLGIFSLKKRKVVSLDETREVYKITIRNPEQEFKYLGIEFSQDTVHVFPLIACNGPLFKKISKKIPMNFKKNLIEFSIDSKGKVV